MIESASSVPSRAEAEVFDTRIGWKPLSQVCRSLATMLHSGVAIQKAVELASKRSSDSRSRQAFLAVSTAVAKGDEVAEAMREQGRAFPPLMMDMVEIGEKT